MATNTAGTVARNFNKQLVHYLRKRITFADDGVSVSVGWIPAGAVVSDAYVIVSTAFNDGTTETVDVGTAGDPDEFLSAVALGTAGKIVDTALATSDGLLMSADTEIVAQWDGGTGGATAGVADIIVEFIPDNDR